MKITAIVVQALILVAAWYLIANRIEANTYFGSVSYNVDVIAENIRWIMLGAACLSIFNIWASCVAFSVTTVSVLVYHKLPAHNENTSSVILISALVSLDVQGDSYGDVSPPGPSIFFPSIFVHSMNSFVLL